MKEEEENEEDYSQNSLIVKNLCVLNFRIILFELSANLFDYSSIKSNWKKLVKLIR